MRKQHLLTARIQRRWPPRHLRFGCTERQQQQSLRVSFEFHRLAETISSRSTLCTSNTQASGSIIAKNLSSSRTSLDSIILDLDITSSLCSTVQVRRGRRILLASSAREVLEYNALQDGIVATGLAVSAIFTITALNLNGIVGILDFDVGVGNIGDSGDAVTVAHGVGLNAHGL